MPSCTALFTSLGLFTTLPLRPPNAFASPKKSTFAGTWVDKDSYTITVTERNNIITSVKYSNGRGSFQGYEVDLYAPIISVDFSDLGYLQSGVLAKDKIQWSDGSFWTRK